MILRADIDLLGGWGSLFCCISLIGLLTAIVGDLAKHMGCYTGLKDGVTAISLVALGTSIPGTPPHKDWWRVPHQM